MIRSFNVNKCMQQFDSILAWIKWSDNRKYFDMWNDDPRITSQDKAREVLGYDVARDIFLNDANLLARTLYDLIKETFYSAYRGRGNPLSVDVLSDISAIKKVEALGEYLRPYGGKGFVEWLDSGATHRTKAGKIIKLKDAWGDYDDTLEDEGTEGNRKKLTLANLDPDVAERRLKIYKNYVYFIFNDILLGKYTPRFTRLSGREKSDPKNLSDIRACIELFCDISTRIADAWEGWVHRNTSRLQKKLYNSQISQYMDENDIDIVDPEKDGPVKSIREIYTDWFRSMGARYRIVPPEMKLDGGSSLIDKFNYVYLIMLSKFLDVKAKKYPDVGQDIRNWLASNPLEGPVGSTVDPQVIESYYNLSTDDVEYPPTVGSDVDFYSSKKNYQFVLRSTWTDKATGEVRNNEKTQEVRVGQVISFVEDIAKKTKNEELKKVCAAMNKAFLKHNLEDIPDKKTCVVISCHEYDIVTQSTNRSNWHSCQDIFRGSYASFVGTGLQAGVLIAYYCDQSDTSVNMTDGRKAKAIDPKTGKAKINISNPLGRILIKPFVKRGEQQDFNDPNWVLIVSKEYGEFPDDLKDKVQEWLDRNWNDDIVAKLGEKNDYDIAKGVYRDTPKERSGLSK